MLAFYLISLAVFIGFIALIIVRYGVPTSVSESYYLLPKGVGQSVFYAFCVLVALPLLMYWLQITAGTTFQFLVFFTCAPLIFVGAAGAFKSFKLTNKVHYIAAAICGTCSQLWIVLNSAGWILIIAGLIFAAAVALAYKIKGVDANYNVTGLKKNATIFFLEMAAFVNTYIAVFGYHLNSV